MRGLWATRHDLPPEAARVHAIASEAIERQMRANAESKAELVRQGVPAVAQNKGRYAWVRLHPGEETGINPRTTKVGKQQSSKEITSEETAITLENQMFSPGSPLPDLHQLQEYVSPYS